MMAPLSTLIARKVVTEDEMPEEKYPILSKILELFI
jgi:hypothetical protein